MSELWPGLPCAGENALKDAVEAGWGVRATASESEGIIGLRDVSKSESDSSFVQSINSSMGVGMSACALFVLCLLLLLLHPVLAPHLHSFVHFFRCTCACLTLALQFVVGHG